MSKPKIAIFGVKYFPSKGGTSRVVENLLLHLKKEFDITVYCYKHPKADQHIEGIKTVQFKEVKVKGFGVLYYYIVSLIHIMKNGKYDLVHVHKVDSAFAIPFLLRKFKVIATSHAIPYKNDKWSWFGILYFKWCEKVFMKSNAIKTSISKPQSTYYEEKYDLPVHFIPNGIESIPEISTVDVEGALKQYDLEPGYIMFAARRIIPLKGAHTMIQALKNLHFAGTLVVAGDIDQVSKYTGKLKEMSKDMDVRFIGYVSDIKKLNALISQCKYFIFPSELEGMSMMLMEVGAVGSPLICSDIEPNKAIFGDAEVLYFKSKNPDDLHERLLWANSHSEKMVTKGILAKERVATQYLITVAAQQYSALYQRTIDVQATNSVQSS